MHIWDTDIWARTLDFSASDIFSIYSKEELDSLTHQRALRDIATRYLVYHEMSHGLQRAYINLSVPEKYKQYMNPYDNEQESLIF